MKPLSTMIRPTAPSPTEAPAMKSGITRTTSKKVSWAEKLTEVREYHMTPKMFWNKDSSELLYEDGAAWIETTKGNMCYVDPSNPHKNLDEFFTMDNRVPFPYINTYMKNAKTLEGGAKRVKRKLNLGPPLRILVEN